MFGTSKSGGYAMAAVKTRWSILVLEDHPDLRESLKANFASLLDNALQVDFAASISHAIDKVKRQMQLGLPYDVFWIDLYLDYFSYENARGEIISVSSFSEIVDTAAFLQHHQLTKLAPQSLVSTLHLAITPPHKNLNDYSAVEKLQLLEKLTPFCLAEAKSGFETFLSLLETYLLSDDDIDTDRAAENTYARYALDSVFRLLINWVSSPKKKFSLTDEHLTAWNERQTVSVLPAVTEKSDQSWTFFRDWVRRFYDAVAFGAKEVEAYTAANPLLPELKRVAPNAYPQFLINTAYEGRRQEHLNAATIWSAEDLIITNYAFKGEKKDKALAEYLSLLCSRLRRPYLFLRSRRRGTSAFVLAEKFMPPTFILSKEIYPDTPILNEPDLGLAFTVKSFYPDLIGHLHRVAEASPEFIQSLTWRALHDLEESLRERLPVEISHLRLYVPENFFRHDSSHDRFYLKVQTIFGKEHERELTFDEGRWLFLELACRRWFPKCFLIHSRWTPFTDRHGEHVYFFPIKDLLAKALKHAAIDHPELFPPPEKAEQLATTFQPGASFYDPDTDYLSAFAWPAFFDQAFGAFDQERKAKNENLILLQAQRLLYLARHLLAELRIQRATTKLLDWHAMTPASLCKILEDCAFSPVGELVTYYLRLVEKAAKTPRLIAEDYLLRIQNFLAVVLCFYSLPSEPLAKFYRFWSKKQIPEGGTRPTEKFSTMSKKLEGMFFMQSLSLPAQAQGKGNFLFVPSALKTHQLQMIVQSTGASMPVTMYSETAMDLTRMSCEEFLNYLQA
jgi:hypothetical protein